MGCCNGKPPAPPKDRGVAPLKRDNNKNGNAGERYPRRSGEQAQQQQQQQLPAQQALDLNNNNSNNNNNNNSGAGGPALQLQNSGSLHQANGVGGRDGNSRGGDGVGEGSMRSGASRSQILDSIQPPAGMSRHGYERVCAWLLNTRDPSEDPVWMDTVEGGLVSEIRTLLASRSPTTQGGHIRADDPLIRRCVKEYDTIRMPGIAGNITDQQRTCLEEVQQLILAGTLEAPNPATWLQRVFQIYLGQDPTALTSCNIAVQLLEDGRSMGEGEWTLTHRQVGLVVDLWKNQQMRALVRDVVQSLTSKNMPAGYVQTSASHITNPNATYSSNNNNNSTYNNMKLDFANSSNANMTYTNNNYNGNNNYSHLSPHGGNPSHFQSTSSLQVLSGRSNRAVRSGGDSAYGAGPAVWTIGQHAPVTSPLLCEGERLVWERRLLSHSTFGFVAAYASGVMDAASQEVEEGWEPFDFDMVKGPGVSDLGYELQARVWEGDQPLRSILPPCRVKFTETVLVAILSSIASEYAKVQCVVAEPGVPNLVPPANPPPTMQGSLTIKPREIILTINGSKKVLGDNVQIVPHPENEVGFSISDDRGVHKDLMVTKQLVGERVALVALVRLFVMLKRSTGSLQVMGQEWERWPTGSKQTNIFLLTRALSYEPCTAGTAVPADLTTEGGKVLLAVKHEWFNARPPQLIKKLCANINIEVPPHLTYPDTSGRRSGMR